MQFPVSTMDGDYMAIKHGIQIEHHYFPHKWVSRKHHHSHPYSGARGYGASLGGPKTRKRKTFYEFFDVRFDKYGRYW